MPHFILDCSENIIKVKDPKEIILKVHDAAESSGLFSKGDIKVRINPFEHYLAGNGDDDFIHVFANVLEGRNAEQKMDLSKRIIKTLKDMFPEVPIISINVRDFEKDSYCNRSMV